MQAAFVIPFFVLFGGCYSQSTQKYQCSGTDNVDCLRNELSISRLEHASLKSQLNDVTQQKENLQKENQELKDENLHLMDVNTNLNKSLEGCSQSSLTPTCNQETGRWISGGHKSNGTFNNTLSKIKLSNQMYHFNHMDTHTMSVVRDQLWVSVFENHTIQILKVYTANKIKEITTTDYAQQPRLLRPDNNGDVFLCSETGLHLLSQNGSYLYIVGDGLITEVHVGCNVAYLYNSTNNNVVTIVYNKAVWVVNNTFLANSSTSSYWNTLLVIGETVYVCSHTRHTIETYTLTGTYITQYGGFGTNTLGKFHYPFFCGIDSQESILVCDRNNHRLQVLSADGIWQVFVLQGVTYPYDLVTDVDDNVWMLYFNGDFKITRFTV